MFDIPFIQIPFGYVLEFFYNFFNNYGIALILFSLAVKILLLPMSAKSKKSSMKMSRIQPKVKELELACGDDKQKYQQQLQQLYKDEGVSAFGGCLWALIPLFILLPLYNVIREPLEYILHLDADVIKELKDLVITSGVEENYWQYAAASTIEGFVGRVDGLAEGVKNLNLTFLGIDLGQTPDWKIWKLHGWSEIGGALFPLISGGLNYLSMFISQKMNNAVISNEQGEKDEALAKSAQPGKGMMMFMPLLSVWFGFIMPLGISVYWIAQSVFGIIQDVFLTIHYRKVYDAEDAVKREKAAERAAEEAERERIRAAKRAANPNGIKENTSKKKQQLREKQEREAAAKDFETKNSPMPNEKAENEYPGGEPNRPYARGRAYSGDHYGNHED